MYPYTGLRTACGASVRRTFLVGLLSAGYTCTWQVNYVAFLRESDPPPAVLAALGQIHSFLSEAAEQDELSPTEALAAVLGVTGIISKLNGGGRVG